MLMMPCETDEESIYSSSSNLQYEIANNHKPYDKVHDVGVAMFPYSPNTKESDLRPSASSAETRNGQLHRLQRENSAELYYHINSNSVIKLKDSTKKLLCVLEEIQSKTHGKKLNAIETNLNKYLKLVSSMTNLSSVTDLINANALKQLEDQVPNLQSMYILDEDDDCSVYKRLTRKCTCLNRHEYNDFIIHFNENTIHRTSLAGEIIKNMRILKKFLYMNGIYTQNALLFLNEGSVYKHYPQGLSGCSRTEKVEITEGCAHADICNIFDEYSIISMYVSWPCKNDYYGNTVTQNLTSSFINKLAQLEEGRRYLNYSSKITSDIKKVIRKKSPLLEFETVDLLNATVNLLQHSLTQNITVTYYCSSVNKGIEKKTINSLIDYRQYMTLDEVIAHLQILQNLSHRENGNCKLTTYFPVLLILFKSLLIEYDNSEMNIILTSILTNIVSKNMAKVKNEDLPKTLIVADIATEPIRKKNETTQHPPKKQNARKINKSKLGLGMSRNKYRNPSQRKEITRSSVIVVPIE